MASWSLEELMNAEIDRRDGWSPDAFPERRTGEGRRAHPRMRVRLAARGSAASATTVPVSELSVGGLYLETELGLQEGDPIEFELLVPGSDLAVRVAGVVTHKHDPDRPGQGIRFGKLDPSDSRVIEGYLDRLARVR